MELESVIGLEWLETNGLGGFASSTVAGINTRRYHGLLTAATEPPVGRMVLLSKLEEVLLIDGRRFDLSANRYPGVVHPQGYRYLKSFRTRPFPSFTYEVEDVEIEKSVCMVHGENTVTIEYELKTGDPHRCALEIRPLIAFRDYHSTTHRNDGLDGRVTVDGGLASITPYRGLPTLHFAHNAGRVDPVADWYLNFEYDLERERGLDYVEDLFCPFAFTFNGASATIIASTEPRRAGDAAHLRETEIIRRSAGSSIIDTLTRAADQFIVKRGNFETIIAGYHWFSDWGRDTMIALPGLTLVTGRFDTARNILLAFQQVVDRGMLPNRFPDAGEQPEYNTVDAALWYFEAIRAYLEYTGDYAFVRERLYSTLKSILDWHLRGTRYGICMDSDGLLRAGEPGVQLTWMDARVGDHVVTPRNGKPVEIQALWYNAVVFTLHLADEFHDGDTALFLRELSALTSRSFNDQFWNDEAGCLYDVADGGARDASIRPNQIFAVSLRHSMLALERSRQVVEVVGRELLTPLGLRSLSPNDPAYRPRYEGDPASRDSSYHQGTVWPWLIGPFITASVKVFGRREQWLEAFQRHIETEGCLGQISEVADGDPPHRPGGCVAQAWSVAEVLRALVEDVYELRPAAAVAAAAGTKSSPAL